MATSISIHGLLLVGLALCFLVCPSFGHQQFRSRIPNGGAIPCPPEDSSCNDGELCEGVGHMSCLGGVEAPERNAFGKDFEEAGSRWTMELCLKDSDGDGFSNGFELGDPCCLWHEGARLPDWMANWEISHPGFPKSTQFVENMNVPEFCKDKKHLDPDSFYNEGEEEINIDYVVEEHTIPSNETNYLQFRFNFPEDKTYYIVGGEPLIDNEEIVHHYVVTSCTERTEKEGVLVEGADMDTQCEGGIYFWAPGSGNYTLPKNAGFSVGKDSPRKGFNLEIHYDNPQLKEGLKDASGVRFHFTTKPREFEVGVLFTGTAIAIGRIPPKKKFYSSTIFQLAVDSEIAPDGLTVFGYGPHMHLLGRRIFTERLRVKEGVDPKGMITDFSQLEVYGDLGRDDTWRFDNQYFSQFPQTTIKNGDIFATTCMYDSEERDEMTTGGLGSRDEMCVGSIMYYPAEAADQIFGYSGPRFTGTLTDEEYESLDSFMDIIAREDHSSALPKWRRAYLMGDLECDESMPGHDFTYDDLVEAVTGGEKGKVFMEDMGKKCGEGLVGMFPTGNETLTFDCNPECAGFMYNFLGCELKRDAEVGDQVMSLVPSMLEQLVDTYCSEVFIELYENKEGKVLLQSGSVSITPTVWQLYGTALLAAIWALF